MEKEFNISASLEDYLKAIHRLENRERVARAKDIARLMSVSRASVTGALKSLSQKGLIDYSPYSYITLTENGRSLARDLRQRHKALYTFFTEVLSYNRKSARELACKLEHDVNSEMTEKLSSLQDFMDKCPNSADCWQSFRNEGCPGPKAEACRGVQTDPMCAACRPDLWPKADEL